MAEVIDLSTSSGHAGDFHRTTPSHADLPVTESAFVHSNKETQHGGDQAETSSTGLAEGFIGATGLAPAASLSADPAVMYSALPGVITELTAISKYFSGLPDAAARRTTMAERLQADAAPVFNRSERPTSEKATAVRLAALCLAAEADHMNRRDLGEQLRRIAAGITILEHRATGERRPVEVIRLAVTE